MAENNDVAIGFQIRSIRVLEFSIHKSSTSVSENYHFNVRINHLFDSEHDIQIVRLSISISLSIEQPPLTELTLECLYQLTNYRHWLAQQANERLIAGVLPTGLAVTLNSISISTARGILYERLKESALQDIILPIIDPSALQVEQ